MTNMNLKLAAESNPGLIPEPYDEIYAAYGFEGLEIVVGAFGKQNIYVPSLRTVLYECIMAEVRKECAGRALPLNGLAKKYGFTPRHLRKILNGR